MTNFSVVATQKYGEAYFLLILRHPATLPAVEAGQFVEVLVENEPNVMLRRPFSIHDVDAKSNTLSLLLQTVGHGTHRLSLLKTGDELNLILPLGNSFSTKGNDVLLVGGGAGIAPLLLLGRQFAAKGVRPTFLLGGRTASLVPARESFEPLGTLAISTEDGSLGEKGLVTDHSVFTMSYDHIYACGPTPMMKAVARYARKNNIFCEVSLENLMACGVGACLCCVVETDQGHRRVCHEGPVFDINHLTKWMA
ncbi:MAG: dihydroorotate dehydrogenase electron transfer subunit [Bacteroidales bacterium]|nr:dihydroorotate dehydrogenase electron transfer subunit [Bacteroidales bacterium]